MSKKEIKVKQDLKIKFGSDDMVLWRDLIDAKKTDIKICKQNLKIYEAILEMAEENYKKAEEEFNRKV
jgi:hypothetical protein